MPAIMPKVPAVVCPLFQVIDQGYCIIVFRYCPQPVGYNYQLKSVPASKPKVEAEP